MASGSASGSKGSSAASGTTSQSTQYTPTPEEVRMQKVYAGQIEAFDPMQRELNMTAGQNVLSLLRGQDLQGYLKPLPYGISEERTADIANRAIKDIQPFFGQAGLLDSGVNASISARTAGDIRRASAEFNINNLMQLLNIGVGGQAQVQQPALQQASTYSQSLAGLRGVQQTGTFANQGRTSQFGWNAGVNLFGGICWVAAELFGGWNKIKTHMVRYYMLYMAPKWLLNAYECHGEAMASYIKDKPILKALLRPFFEVFAFLGSIRVKEVCHG